jgi:hypothetical protein|tara:strand:+ start:244 stop:486 length:243 start_codon:yes stop_codon:yes gene_type:complete
LASISAKRRKKMREKTEKNSLEKNEMFMRSIEGELEQLHGTLHNTNTQLIKTNQELRMVKWSMIVVVILLALIAVKLGAF